MQTIVFEKKDSHLCTAFITNNHTKNAATIRFRDTDYFLPPRSISILPDCKTVVFNTQNVASFTLAFYKAFKFLLCSFISPCILIHIASSIRLLHNIIQGTSRRQKIQTISTGRCLLRAFQTPRIYQLV